MSVSMMTEPKTDRARGRCRLVARRGDLPDLPALLSGPQRRRRRRSRRHHRAARLRRGPRRRRHLALAVLHLADEGLRLRRLQLPRRRSDLRHAGDFDRLVRKGPCAGAQGHHRPGDLPLLRQARLVLGKPLIRTNARPTGMSGPIPSPTAPRPTTGSRSSAAPPGRGTAGACNITCTISSLASPISTSTIPTCRMRCWAKCASGWSAASMASGSTRSISTSARWASKTIPSFAPRTSTPPPPRR